MYVYVISAGPDIQKIGISGNPARRLAGLQQQTPLDLALGFTLERSDARVIEQAAHRLLAAHRVRSEWFSVSLDVAVDGVRRAIAGERAPRQERESELTGAGLAAWRRSLKLGVGAAAKALGVSPDTYFRMERRPLVDLRTALACSAITSGLSAADA